MSFIRIPGDHSKERREVVLKQLHISHPGICQNKGLARSYVWWPGIYQAIQDLVHKCYVCQLHQANLPKPSFHPSETSKRPWSRVHIDQILILIDSYTKWLEVHIIPSTSSEATIQVLHSIFATHGCPEQLVSENGSAFVSSDFKSFLLHWE